MVTIAPQLAAPYCDSIVLGSAETVWHEVLEDLKRRRLQPIYHRDLESLSTPLPRFDVILGKRIGDFLPVQAARGCVHCCRFCTIYCIYRGRYFRRPVSEIIRDIRHVKSLGFRKFLLLDDNIMSDRDFMLGPLPGDPEAGHALDVAVRHRHRARQGTACGRQRQRVHVAELRPGEHQQAEPRGHQQGVGTARCSMPG